MVRTLALAPALSLLAGCYCAHRVDRFTYGDDAQLDAGARQDATLTDDATNDAGLDASIPVTLIAAGGSHTCAVRGGVVLCWGRNDEGEVGDGTVLSPRATPTLVEGLEGVERLAAGRLHTCALRSSGSQVFCWGSNDLNQLGVFDGAQRSMPILVRGVSPAEIATGDRHTCVRRNTGLVACWGDNSSGQLGDATGTPQPDIAEVWALDDASAIALGGRHSCAVRSSGAAACWGANDDGQLGNGLTTRSLMPDQPVQGLTDAVQVSAGTGHSCALRSTGGVTCWGRNDSGQLGNGMVLGSTTPVQVTGVTGAVQVSAGYLHTCARLGSGSVICWGDNAYGQLGDGHAPMRSMTPVEVVGLTDAVDVSAGGGHTCAVRSNGHVVCWGANDSSQLGDGTTITRSAPVPVLGL